MTVQLGAAFANVDPIGTDFGAIRDIVQTLEDTGFDSISTNDHVIGGHPDRAKGERVHLHPTGIHEPLVLLSFIGAVTSRVELVTWVLLLPQRQTTLVAKQVAELDLLSQGRVRLGVGVGRNWMEYEALNQDFTNRGKRIEEQVEILRRYWTEDLVTFKGIGTSSTGSASARRPSSVRSRFGWAHSTARSSSGCWNGSAAWPMAGCPSSHPTNSARSWSESGAMRPTSAGIPQRSASSAPSRSPRTTIPSAGSTLPGATATWGPPTSRS